MGDDDVRCGNVNSEGGSDEWRSIADGRIRSIAGNTLIDILSIGRGRGRGRGNSSVCVVDVSVVMLRWGLGEGLRESAIYQIIFFVT
jgi:hypothetical protein